MILRLLRERKLQTVHTINIQCSAADTLPLDAIEDFQGGLKKRSKKDIELLIKSIQKYGFTFPFFVWQNEGRNLCLDGHGRLQALTEMRRRGFSLPEFPVVYVNASNEEEAKNKLLRLNSQYGKMTIDSVLEFVDGVSVAFDELALPDGIFFNTLQNSVSDMPILDSGEKEPFQQMTFTLADEQAVCVKQAIDAAIKTGLTETIINTNRNGNALAYICKRYLDGC